MVKSLTMETQQIIQELLKDGLCAIAYDNLDFDFKLKEVTIENPGTFESITTGTFILMGHGATLDLWFSDKLWKKSSLNPQGAKDVTPSQPPSDKYLLKQVVESMLPVESVMLWYIKSVIIEEYLPSSYKDLLGPMPSSKWIDVEKSTQQPAHMMHIKASSNDGNVEIVENLGVSLVQKVNGMTCTYIYVMVI